MQIRQPPDFQGVQVPRDGSGRRAYNKKGNICRSAYCQQEFSRRDARCEIEMIDENTSPQSVPGCVNMQGGGCARASFPAGKGWKRRRTACYIHLTVRGRMEKARRITSSAAAAHTDWPFHNPSVCFSRLDQSRGDAKWMDESSLCPASCLPTAITLARRERVIGNVTNRVQILGRQTCDAIILSEKERSLLFSGRLENQQRAESCITLDFWCNREWRG